jgi:hypothetical protein
MAIEIALVGQNIPRGPTIPLMERFIGSPKGEAKRRVARCERKAAEIGSAASTFEVACAAS